MTLCRQMASFQHSLYKIVVSSSLHFYYISLSVLGSAKRGGETERKKSNGRIICDFNPRGAEISSVLSSDGRYMS